MTKYKVGDIVWARVSGHRSVWWPGQISPVAEACEEAYCKQLPGHFLVCLYGNPKWCWLPVQRLADFEAGYSEHAKYKGRGKDGKDQGPRPAVWHAAIEEAKEALDRSRGRPVAVRHNPPAQLYARGGQQPVAACEVVYGYQQHPRAQLLLQALQKGAIALGHGAAGSSGGRGNRGNDNKGEGSQAGDAGSASVVSTRGARDSTSGKGGFTIPAWPEFVHEASATPADVQAVEASEALTWLRCLARGCAPPTQLAPEQEVAARQQLVSLDLTRRQAALEAIMTASGVRAAWDKQQPTTPKQQKKNSKPMGLQPGTHSLSLPEDVARSLAPVRQHLQQEHHLLMNPPEIKTDAVTGRRMGGGGNVLGTAAVDLVLRINGTILPFTCPVSVQTIAQTTTSSTVTASSPTASSQPAPTANILIQYRIGGLHTVLQQLMPMALPSPASPTNSSANNHHHSDRGTSFMAVGSGDKGSEKQLLPGPVVEGWQPLGPHQIMLSLTVIPALLHVVAPRPLAPASCRTSGGGSTSLCSPRSPGPVVSPSAGLLSTYGVTLPPGPAFTRKRLANQMSVPGAVAFPQGLSNDGSGFIGQRRITDSASDPAEVGGSTGRGPSKRHRSDGGDGMLSPRSSTGGRTRGSHAAPPKRPPWSSRVTPYDPSDPFSHPLLPYGARSYPPSSTQLNNSPGVPPPPPLNPMGPPQPRQLSGAPSLARRTSESAYLGSLQIHTSGSASAVDLHGQDGGGGSPMHADEQSLDAFTPHVSGSLQLGAAGEGQQQGQEEQPGTAGTTAAAAATAAVAIKPGVLLVEVRVGTVSTRTPSHTSVTLPAWPGLSKATAGEQSATGAAAVAEGDAAKQGNGAGGEVTTAATGAAGVQQFKAGQWARSRVERGLSSLLQQLTQPPVQQQGDTAHQQPASLLTPYLRAVPAATPTTHDPNKLASKPSVAQGTAAASHGDGSARKPPKTSQSTSPGQHPPDGSESAAERPPHSSSHPHKPRAAGGRKSPEPETDAADAVVAVTHHRPGSGHNKDEWRMRVDVDHAAAGAATGLISPALHHQEEVCGGGDAPPGAPHTTTATAADAGCRTACIPGPGPYATPLPPVASPTTPQQDVPFIRSQTPEGQHLQGLAEQLSRAAQAVRALPMSKTPAAALHPNTMEVLTTLREKAAAVAGRVMVGSLSSGDSQLRSEPLQHLLHLARETLAACDAAAATAIASHTMQNSAARVHPAASAHGGAANASAHHMGAYANVASASAAMLQLLGSSGDEDDDDDEEDESGSGDEDEEGGSMTGGSSSEVNKARRLGALGGLEEPEIEALQTLAAPLAEVAPSAVAALNSLVSQALSAVMPGGQPGVGGSAAQDSKLDVLQAAGAGGLPAQPRATIHA